MKKNMYSDIKNLKSLLNNNQISLIDAIDKFAVLLDDFQNKEEELLISNITLNAVNRELLEKNKIVKDRIKNLNRILLLQELGIQFNEEEMYTLLSK
ncbi:hypothetical protein [Aquimarina algicola]|uniref:Uncharacterized protein n=1 Tax=Aquimarina algicola TaxID=2589995 RepID=A0A504J2G0_9FLAO|nr:hypothetical protein [Aquimarina algicola]TPN82805.1 hypothetical protein FHK87_20475 [Aquimarina algicola]